ncbi:MAG TPA: hypothetical protein VNN08_14655 [Thermoanaerobaculia bacterium]|nr:hypothetical protein [Thermoanaerobaculia bacterium]
MAETKTEEPAKPVVDEEADHWAHYRSIQLTPEQVAAGRARLQKDIDRARADGVYEKLMEWKAGRIVETATTKAEEPAQQAETKEDRWARYERGKLPPERVAELQAALQKRIDKARAEGVYEGLLKLQGKVHWDIDIDALREDRD